VNILTLFFLKESLMRLLSVFPIKDISNGALVAITLMIAESNPEEKDVMTTLVMNLLRM
jgi:hypothetical protein